MEKFLTQTEAQEALKEGKRVRFHWNEMVVPVSLDTSLDDLRWMLKARMTLLVSDVTNGKYSIQTVHELKIEAEYFEAVELGWKTFEIRKNDRGFEVGDILILQEYENGQYTGEKIEKEVTYMTTYNQEPGYVVMAIA